MKRASTMVLVALLSVLTMAVVVAATDDIQRPQAVELAVLGTPDPQAPVREDDPQAPVRDDEIQAPRIAA